MPVRPDAVAHVDGENDEEDQFIGGIVKLENGERPEVELLRQGAAAAATGRPYEQTIVSYRYECLYNKKNLTVVSRSMQPTAIQSLFRNRRLVT